MSVGESAANRKHRHEICCRPNRRDLRELLALNPGFRVLISHGRGDLVTSYGVSRYLLDHMPAIGGEDRAQLKVHRGGHMFYLEPDARAAFTADAGAFYRGAGCVRAPPLKGT